MKLSRTITYAVQATLALSERPRGVPISCRQLADHGQMPEKFLLQVLRTLAAHGILRSAIGVFGGFYLARSPDKITMLQIIEAFDNPLTSASIPRLPGFTPLLHERLLACVAESALAARQRLECITIADLSQSTTNICGAVNGDFSTGKHLSVSSPC